MSVLIRISLVFFLVFSQSAFGQLSGLDSASTSLYKNSVHGTVGMVLIYGQINGSYERMIIERKDKMISSYWLRFGAGAWGSNTGNGTHALVNLMALTGSKESHLEVSIGLNVMYDQTGYRNDVFNRSTPDPTKSDHTYILPGGLIGYRYQKPGSHYLFRTGIGLPETVYVSFGYCF